MRDLQKKISNWIQGLRMNYAVNLGKRDPSAAVAIMMQLTPPEEFRGNWLLNISLMHFRLNDLTNARKYLEEAAVHFPKEDSEIADFRLAIKEKEEERE